MRSKLFVPGSRPELFDKALASAADAISFDLEDAVTPERKPAARAAIAALLRRVPERRPAIIVRINPLGSAYARDDIDAIALGKLDTLNLPKTESADEVRTLAGTLARLERERGLDRPIGILPNIETPRGLRLAAEIAAAHPRVIGLQLGLGDLFEPAGIDRADTAAVHAVQLAMRLSAAEAGRPAYDGAFANVSDREGYRTEARAARGLGYAGKSCIHPSQIPIANAVFSPDAAALARARRIVEAAGRHFGAGTGAFLLDGAMIDEPFVARARALLERAEEAE